MSAFWADTESPLQMVHLDLRRPLQISDGAHQLQDAVEGAGAHAQLLHGGAYPRERDANSPAKKMAGPKGRLLPASSSLQYSRTWAGPLLALQSKDR